MRPYPPIAEFALLLTASLLMACGKSERSAGVSEEIPAAEVAPHISVEATDEFGPAQGRISGFAFWTHPTLPFQGLVIAAGAGGLSAFEIETGDLVAGDEGFDATGLGIAWTGKGPTAQGYAVAGVPDGLRIYAIDNITREFTFLPALLISNRREVNGFCIGRAETGNGFIINEMTTSGWRSTPVRIVNGVATAGETTIVRIPNGLTACAADDIDGVVFAANARGELFRLKAGEAPKERFAATGIRNPVGVGIALNGLVAGGSTDQSCGQVAVLDGETGTVRIFDREDGRTIGSATLSASFDVAGVTTATAFGLAYGNFGGPYRDGVLALGIHEDAALLRLAPFNGVMDALGAPLGQTSDPRDLDPAEEEDPLRLDIRYRPVE